MIIPLDAAARTHRNWTGRDDIHQHYIGRIPTAERSVTLSLGWKKEAAARIHPVGRFKFEMPQLVAAGFAREVDGFFVLRFQRSGRSIEVAVNRSSPARMLARLPSGY